MRFLLLLPFITLAACATAPKDLESMSTAEVCYVGLTERGMGPVAGAEIQRRDEDCGNHIAELAQMADYEKRVRPGIKGPLSIAPKTSPY